MKKVAILLRDNLSMTDKKILSVNKDLNTFLDKYNVIPIYFYITDYNYSKIKELLDISDGVILPGGDVFNSNVEKILKYLYLKNIPTLGICQGMQEIALFCSGKLGRLNNNKHLSNKEYVHEIIIDDKSKLYKILNKKRITVNSRHRDYVLYTKANRVAYSKDYFIEAIEIPTKKFFKLSQKPEKKSGIPLKKFLIPFKLFVKCSDNLSFKVEKSSERLVPKSLKEAPQ